jgi:hypothetical protein
MGVGAHSWIGRIMLGSALLVGSLAVPGAASAHYILVAPDAWMSQSTFGDPQKVGPCGNEGGGTPTGRVTAFRPGETIEVTVNETIFHPGHYRVVLAIDDRGELPPPPAVTAVGTDPCGSAEIQDPPIFPILVDNALPHTQPFEGPQTFTVTLPTDVTCTKCTLQVIEYMSSHGRPCFYYHCADIAILGEATPTPTATPIDTAAPPSTVTATAAVLDTSTATPAPPTGCAGDCDADGAITVNEIVVLVGIALEQTPIGACTAGNTDGNQRITIDEILAALNWALDGCADPMSTGHGEH